MIRFPTSPDEAVAAGGMYRAGGTDLQERRRHRITTGDLADLRDLAGLDTITTERRGGGLRIGALATVAAIADDPTIRSRYPGLALAAGGLATPQIRARATLGGNLAQEVRCWYFRSPRFRCLKQGGSTCHARAGDHLYHACFDQGPCAAPHPSTLAMALLAYDAVAVLTTADGEEERSIAALVGDGQQPTKTNDLSARELITAVRLPPPATGERAAYFRAISRSRAEWPLVEVLARLQIEEGTIVAAWVAMGGVANTPLRLPEVETSLRGQLAADADLAAAAALAAEGAAPLPMTGYKVDLIPGTVLETLERALSGGGA